MLPVDIDAQEEKKTLYGTIPFLYGIGSNYLPTVDQNPLIPPPLHLPILSPSRTPLFLPAEEHGGARRPGGHVGQRRRPSSGGVGEKILVSSPPHRPQLIKGGPAGNFRII